MSCFKLYRTKCIYYFFYLFIKDFTSKDSCLHGFQQPASAKWYDRRDYVFIEFCVEDSKEVKVDFEKDKLTFNCLGGADSLKHLNEVDLFQSIDPNESKHKRTDRSVLCCIRKAESGRSWPRLTKEKAKLNWLSVDFNNWKDWEDDSEEDLSNFDRFSEMMNNMGGDEDVDLPEVDGADDVSCTIIFKYARQSKLHTDTFIVR
uniref:Prostaglandin E synthase 3 n=1 Tax=Leptobrachium leishanense TaxID=445787 RepID=A0A8C5Q9N2_9ANUR